MAYYLTINIEEQGTVLKDGGNSGPGHMWYSLYDSSTNQTNNYGFAPIQHGAANGPGRIYPDDDETYLGKSAYSRTVEITEEQYEKMKNFGDDPEQNGQFIKLYTGGWNDCINFVYKALEIGGINHNREDGLWWPMENKDNIEFLLTHHMIEMYMFIYIPSFVRDLWNSAQNFIRRYDPLTIDLDGDGIETVAASTTNPILFDHDGDGVKNGTGWINADDGFLVLDRNGNGAIDNGTELFGDATPWAGGGPAADGFAALAQEDTTADGVVNNLDTRWSQLRIWRDLNQDGISQAGELLTMAQAGIIGFDVNNVVHNQILPNGNQIAETGTFTRADGTTGLMGELGKMADVNLTDDTFYREFPDQIPLVEGVADLPDMKGSGKVRDLHEAASQSTRIKSLLTQYSQATTRQDQRALLD